MKTKLTTKSAILIMMFTIGHWTKDGVVDEEFLMWDNHNFMKQIGMGQ